MTNLDMLMSQLGVAVARAPKRKPRQSARHGMTAEAQRALIAGAEANQQDARAALDAADRAAERKHYQRYGKLSALGKRRVAARKALEGAVWGSLESARLLMYMRAIDSARANLFAQPVLASELADGGRFYRRAVWLGLEVGMLAVDEIDIVAGAVELCYLKGQTAEAVTMVRTPVGWTRETVLMPTIGGMYRNMKLFYHGQLDRFRRNKSAGLVAVHSIDALAEAFGSDWLDANSARLDNLGFGYADPTEYPAVMVTPDQLPASRAALAAAHSDRQKLARRRSLEAVARDTLAAGAPVPDGFDRQTFEADRLAIRAIINGAGIDAVAALCNVSAATVTQRLLALEGTLGQTRYSGATDSVPVRGTKDPTPRVRALHETNYMQSSREGTRATPVVVTTR